ncbi:MAG: sialidase family protein [Ktedonobacteraceae bacterium]
MHRFSFSRWRTRAILASTLAVVLTFASSIFAFAAVPTVQISSDPYTNSTSEHHTMVEPDTYSFGSTIVAAIQSGRFTDGGASNIGWATSTNGGGSWANGFLPGTTVFATPAGPYNRVSDPTVAYDAAHNTWMIASLAISTSGGSVLGAAVIVNQSTNGGTTWSNPVVVHAASGSENLDKDWIVCDSTSTSAFYGHCYAEWDDNGGGNVIHMSTSTDGGNTWGSQKNTANNATGIGGQPLVQPNGTVIVPIDNANETSVLAFTSTNGGTSWSSTVTVASIRSHTDAGSIRSGPLPSAEIDGAGKVFVVWEDCRFESRCRANDIVMSTSSNGTSWSAVTRIPADAVGSGVDHFIPGITVDKSTSGSTAHLVLAYYYYPVSSCSSSTCKLDIGYSSSTDGGSHWTSTTNITGPMTLSWLANTTQGRMVGDYMSTSFNGSGVAFPVFADASVPTGGTSCGSTGVTCNEGMFTVVTGLTIHRGLFALTNDAVVAGSDHAASSLPLTAR